LTDFIINDKINLTYFILGFNMKKTLFLIFLLLLIFSSCSPDETPGKNNSYYSFTDDAGVCITLEKKPERVAVLFSSFADIWICAGGEISITVGETVERGFADSSVLLVDSGAGKTINTELLISYAPDFIICSLDISAQAETADILNNAGIPTAQFRVESFDDYLHMLDICTSITGNKQAYKTSGTDIKEKIDTLISSCPPENTEQKSFLFIRAASSIKSTKAKTADNHFVCEMLDSLGAYNIADSAPILLDGLSIEEIITADPDFIFISPMGNEEAAIASMETILSDTAWQPLSAVKNGNYHYLSKELFQFKPNAKWYDAYETLAAILYDSKK